ncbi:PTS sugar transporter subunit IIA [Fusobacterium sp.]|uniref:PTS sugar transporter subunit IIA n=1 Tax=Fusobacterium sp. TaxID=68766 RepID=UPI00262C7E2F|nr:PTS sugar transporter subunit IIA [Fusobacterium sp.]
MVKYTNEKLIKFIKGKNTKEEILEKIVNLISENTDLVEDKDIFFKNIMERENIGSTGIGMGIAMPHTRCDGVKDLVVSIAVLENAVDFGAIDGELIKVVVLVGGPKEKGQEYLKLMSSIARIFREKDIRDNIKTSRNEEELIKNIMEIEN